jgi:hypothetical protein
MSNPSNLEPVNLSPLDPQLSSTKYFNNFFVKDLNIATNVNDSVIAFFDQYTGNQASAKILATSVILTSLAQNINPMSTLAELKKVGRGELNTYLAMFLNLNRVGTSLLGLNNQPITSNYVKRTIMI